VWGGGCSRAGKNHLPLATRLTGLDSPRTGAKASGKGKIPTNYGWEDRA
jgi:hypothetical protein